MNITLYFYPCKLKSTDFIALQTADERQRHLVIIEDCFMQVQDLNEINICYKKLHNEYNEYFLLITE